MQIKTLYILFSLAIIMFIAKPFIGFSLTRKNIPNVGGYSLLIKCFSKRKPEDLEDARSKASAIKRQLTSPPQNLKLTFAALVALFFPLALRRTLFTGSFIAQLKNNLIPPAQPYLLSGKLTI